MHIVQLIRNSHSFIVHKTTFFLVCTIFITLTFNTSCSRKTMPEVSYSKAEVKTSNRELNLFLKEGYGKKLTTGNIKPDDIIRSARKYLGVPHCMGGSSSKCMDCSGLVMRAFANNGIQLPHNSEAQARYGNIIQNKSQLQKGDLVFFVNTYKTSKYITHAGIFIGNNQFIHTSSSKGVTITSMDNSWWKDKFIFGTRVF